MNILIPVLCIVVAAMLGMPIWLAFMVGMIPYFGFLESMMPAQIIMQQFMKNTESYSLLAIPLFVTSGVIMNYAGLSRRLMDFADAVCGHLAGGLAHVNVVLSVLQGGCSGSANADAAMDANMLCPEMEKRGYSKAFAAAVSAASSAATPVIPPGVNLVVYTLIAQASQPVTFPVS